MEMWSVSVCTTLTLIIINWNASEKENSYIPKQLYPYEIRGQNNIKIKIEHSLLIKNKKMSKEVQNQNRVSVVVECECAYLEIHEYSTDNTTVHLAISIPSLKTYFIFLFTS